MRLVARLLALGLLACAGPLASGARGEPPPNDDFRNAAPLTGLPLTVDASTEGATRESGEPDHGYPNAPLAGRSSWWAWAAPRSGPVAVQSCAAGFSTATAVYTGDSLAALDVVGRPGTGNEFRWCDGAGSRVAFFATARRVYRIAVDSQDSWPVTGRQASGPYRLEIRQAGTVGVRQSAGETGMLARVVYRAAPGEANSGRITLDWASGPGVYELLPEPPAPPVGFFVREEQLALVPGPGCSSASFGGITCGIPTGARAVGPDVSLGDMDDTVSVAFSRIGTSVFGGPGDDWIGASGDIYAGPGDDTIHARPWSPARIAGGPGNDSISGSFKADVIDPGSGNDQVQDRPGPLGPEAADLVRTRDRDVDFVSCGSPATALIDGWDAYPEACGRVRRRGAARAVARDFTTYPKGDTPHAYWDIQCPSDGPRICSGSLTAAAHGVILRTPFRLSRAEGFDTVFLDASRKRLRALGDDVKVTVRSRDRKGVLRDATMVFHEVQS